MAKTLTPHSAEWFEELRNRSPLQAAMTAQIVERAGTWDCCGICGGKDGVADYMSDEQLSVRLCQDCKCIQEKMHGAMFVPLSR